MSNGKQRGAKCKCPGLRCALTDFWLTCDSSGLRECSNLPAHENHIRQCCGTATRWLRLATVLDGLKSTASARVGARTSTPTGAGATLRAVASCRIVRAHSNLIFAQSVQYPGHPLRWFVMINSTKAREELTQTRPQRKPRSQGCFKNSPKICYCYWCYFWSVINNTYFKHSWILLALSAITSLGRSQRTGGI